ncbi:MAG TPA: hypothetical protein VEZ48_09530 [Sphingomonadaceae bacterium]|nr:hypothetical protein [Sphingomonadaceae bacterium]
MRRVFESQRQTRREKAAVISALNLFFGALIGANLGAFERLPMSGYILLITVLAGSVMVLRIVSLSDRKAYKLRMLAIYIVAVPFVLVVLASRAEIEVGAFQRLGVTLVIWLALVLITELTPARDETAAPAGATADED